MFELRAVFCLLLQKAASDYRGEGGVVAGDEAAARGFVIIQLGEAGLDEAVAGGESEGTDELALGAAVAVAEGVHGVDLAEIVSGTRSEAVRAEVFQAVLFGELG